MTAVAVHQNGHRQQYNPRQSPHTSPHQSRPQSYSQTPSLHNGTPQVLSSRVPLRNDLPSDGEGPSTNAVAGASTSAAYGHTNGEFAHNRRLSLQIRPTSAPNTNAESSQDESERDRPRRRPKPLLQRSKSDYGPRGEEPDSPVEDEIQDWGARHGFEDHYASEEYVNALANVGCSFPMSHSVIR
jgi:regulator-associated protein of mTOR